MNIVIFIVVAIAIFFKFAWPALSLKLAIAKAKRIGEYHNKSISLVCGEAKSIYNYVDSVDGWAGTAYIKREGNRFYAYVAPNYMRGIPALEQSLFVNYCRVSRSSVEIKPGDIVRERNFDSITELAVAR